MSDDAEHYVGEYEFAAWFWSDEWQETEAEADAEIASGNLPRGVGLARLKEHLDMLKREGGGEHSGPHLGGNFCATDYDEGEANEPPSSQGAAWLYAFGKQGE